MASSYPLMASGSSLKKKTSPTTGIESLVRVAPDPVKLYNGAKPTARSMKVMQPLK